MAALISVSGVVFGAVISAQIAKRQYPVAHATNLNAGADESHGKAAQSYAEAARIFSDEAIECKKQITAIQVRVSRLEQWANLLCDQVRQLGGEPVKLEDVGTPPYPC